MPSLVTIDAAVPCHHRRSRSFVLLNEAVRRSEGSGTPHRLSAKGFRHQILRFAQNDREDVLHQILRFAQNDRTMFRTTVCQPRNDSVGNDYAAEHSGIGTCFCLCTFNICLYGIIRTQCALRTANKSNLYLFEYQHVMKNHRSRSV